MTSKQNKKENKYIPLSEASKLTGYTPEHLNLLSRKGKLKAEKIGRNWYTKVEWVNLLLTPVPEESNEGFLITLSEAAKLTGYTPEYLNSLTRKGDLKAEKIGRNWHTKTEWIKEFLASVPGQKDKKIPSTEEAAVGTDLVFSEDGKEKEEDGSISKIPESESKNSWMRIFALASSAIIIMPLLFAGSYVARNFFQNYNAGPNLAEIYGGQENFKIINEVDRFGAVAGEEDTNMSQDSVSKSNIVLASENFRATNVNVGGDIIILENGENLDLEIYDIKSESFVAGKQEEVKLVVSWKTNKMALSNLEYSKNSGQNPKTVEENSYGFNHSVVLAELEPRTSYVYQIECKDRWANVIDSNFFGIYTASKPISVFDLIANALGEIFGWAF